jgi:tetratricopeptide (TPR) repeat protein
MKLRIETLTTLLMLTIILLTGCSGCAQKSKQQTPIDAAPEAFKKPANDDKPTQQEVDVDTEQDLQPAIQSPHIYQKGGTLLFPFPRPIIPPEVDKRANAEVKKRLAALKMAGEDSEIRKNSEIRKGENIIHVEAIGNLAYAQYLAHHWAYRSHPFSEKALAANPDDYETLLTWVYTYMLELGENYYDDEERVVALRRLHEMNPDHPYILHELAIAILPQHPEEALRYAKKAQQLEYRYRWEGIDGMCYFQLGDYEKALTAFERADAAAEGIFKRASLGNIKYVKRIMDNPELLKRFQRLREEKKRLMFPNVLLRDH